MILTPVSKEMMGLGPGKKGDCPVVLGTLTTADVAEETAGPSPEPQAETK
ncbi:MAG TPA: hypothetical protein VEJ18_09920 [Planctomycetota bacterium]|nr:hypothetical protein [Planctomycetota bacterium]